MGENASKTHTMFIGDLDADEDAKEKIVWMPDHAGTITAAYVGAKQTVAKHGTDYETLALKNGSTTMASVANNTAGTAFTAGALTELTLSTTNASRDYAAGDTITLEPTKGGSGSAIGGATVVIKYHNRV